jgi:hypothetical protein
MRAIIEFLHRTLQLLIQACCCHPAPRYVNVVPLAGAGQGVHVICDECGAEFDLHGLMNFADGRVHR